LISPLGLVPPAKAQAGGDLGAQVGVDVGQELELAFP
jgi:hypothetical protein